MNEQNFKDLTNYDKLLQTAAIFKSSQGSYGRMYEDLLNMDEDEIAELNKEQFLKNCKDTLDVVMAIEG